MAVSLIRSYQEPIKNGASLFAFGSGLIAAYDLFQVLRGRPISTDLPEKPTLTRSKVILIAAKLSLLLSALSSRPGVFLIGTLASTLFSPTQLTHTFGPNTIFAINPYHPRHIASIAATLLALPSLIQWLNPPEPSDTPHFPSDTTIHIMALINTLFGRPLLHTINQRV